MLGIHFLKVRESNTNDEQQFSYNPLVIKHEKFLKKTCTLYLDFSTLIILFLTPLMLFSHFALGHQENHFRRICPGCPHQHIHNILRKEISPSPDDLRLEAIKHQILTKLGLRNRPDVNKTMTQVPRHLALETLYRAEAHPNENLGERNTYFEKDHRKDGISDFFFTSYKYSYENRESEELMTQKIMSTESLEKIENDGRHRSTEIEIDDFYARTSEIITFAEPGDLSAKCSNWSNCINESGRLLSNWESVEPKDKKLKSFLLENSPFQHPTYTLIAVLRMSESISKTS